MPRKTRRRRFRGSKRSRRIRRVKGTRRVRTYYRGGNTRYNSEGGDWEKILNDTKVNVLGFVDVVKNQARRVYKPEEQPTSQSNPTPSY